MTDLEKLEHGLIKIADEIHRLETKDGSVQFDIMRASSAIELARIRTVDLIEKEDEDVAN